MTKELVDKQIPILEVTGRMWSGKSTATAKFKKLHIPVVDADEVAHDIVLPGMPAFDDIVGRWQDVETDEGIDRDRLRELTFGAWDEDAIKELESIMHPRISEATTQMLARASGLYVIYERPALAKSSNIKSDHKLAIVRPTTHEKEVSGVVRRGRRKGQKITAKEAGAMLARQLTNNELTDWSDSRIINKGSVAQLNEKVQDWHIRHSYYLGSGQKKKTPDRE